MSESLGPFWYSKDLPANTIRPEVIEKTVKALLKNWAQNIDHLTSAEVVAVGNDPRIKGFHYD